MRSTTGEIDLPRQSNWVAQLITFILITGIVGILGSAIVHRHRERMHDAQELCAP